MKFAHLADVHIGAWRDPRLSALPLEAFEKAIGLALARRVDFILIAGDLLHSAMPGIEPLRAVVRSLNAAKAAGVAVYAIPGSHDFSPTGKTMLGVLEEAGLLVNVFRGSVVEGRLRLEPVIDPRSGALVTGMLGRRGMLERSVYDSLDAEWLGKRLANARESVFLFHTALDELKPSSLGMMESSSVSMLPKGFSYYAGGHVHIVADKQVPGYGPVVYPGPLFPTGFSELEALKGGGMVFYDDGRLERFKVSTREVVAVRVDVSGLTPAEVSGALHERLAQEEVAGRIVLLRLSGSLREGAAGDIDIRSAVKELEGRGAYVVLRNAAGVAAPAREALEPRQVPAAQIEEEALRAMAGKTSCPFDDEVRTGKELLRLLSRPKAEGQTKGEYEDHLVDDAKKLLGL